MKAVLVGAISAVALLGLSSGANAGLESFTFSSPTVTANFSVDVVGGQAISGTGDLTSPFWAGSDPMTLVTLATPDVHDLGGGNLSFRFGGGTDLIGDTAVPIDSGGLVFAVATVPSSLDVGFNVWSNGGGSYTGFIAGNSPGPDLPIIYYGVNGVVGASPVPEPATWAMMLVGLAGLGYLASRKTRKDVAPTLA